MTTAAMTTAAMTPVLKVDTALIRQAAGVLQDAASALDPGCEPVWDCPLTDESLGRSAVAREVAGAAARRVLQACAATRSLAAQVSETAASLRNSAHAFDAAESSIIAPPR